MAAHFEERGIQRSVTMTASDAASAVIAPGTLFRITCTVAGNVTVLLEDGTTEVIAAALGYFTLPYRVVRVNSTGTTATATYANLYANVI